MSRAGAERFRQLAEGATRAATLLDRWNATPDAADEATAVAGEHWSRVMDELLEEGT